MKRQWKNLRGKFRNLYLDYEQKMEEIRKKKKGGAGGAAGGAGGGGGDDDPDRGDESDNDEPPRSPGKKKSGDKGDKSVTESEWRYYDKLSFLKKFIHAAE